MKHSTALPIAYVTLQILIIVNWVVGGGIFALLVASIFQQDWTMHALGASGFTAARWAMMLMRSIAALGLAAVVFNYAILHRLLAIVVTVRRGDPFVRENAYRLNAVAWFLLAIQLLSIAIALIGRAIAAHGQFHLDAGFSAPGWLAVMLTFVLARVFAKAR